MNLRLARAFEVFCLNEYKVVYWEDASDESAFRVTVRSKFQQEINELAQDGWVVKFSNIATFLRSSAEKSCIGAYALLEREIIPAPFRKGSKTTS
jgi:hypothetical protein